METGQKVLNLYNAIKNNFYLCRDDLVIGKEKFNSALLFGILTELNKGKQLYFGEYGGGKTTSAEYLHSLFNSLPISVVKRAVIRGSPQLTQEKMIARPNYGKLNQGKEEVVWQHFVLVQGKIIDEFNRIPEASQAMLLDGVDRGEFGYLNEHISTGRQPFFATCNYEDKGSNSLIPAMLDRFDVAVESKFPGVSNSLAIAEDYYSEKDKMLEDDELSRKMLEILNSGKPYEEIKKGIKELSDKFREILTKRGLETLIEEELISVNSQIKEIGLEKDALNYLSFLISELNVQPKYGQKRSNDPISNEEGSYLYNLLSSSGTRREDKSLVRYAKSLAWIQGKKEADLEHVLTVAPYILWHRIRLSDDILDKLRDNERSDPLNLYVVKFLLGDGTDEISGVKKRFIESKENYQNVLNCIAKGKIDDARKLIEIYSANGKGHPIFIDLKKELE